MPLTQDVIDGLLVAKGLLSKIRFLPVARPDRISLAQSILTAHDAAELALAAVARHLNRLPEPPQTYLMQYFPAIQEEHPGEIVGGRDFFSQLNTVRIAIKHKGIFPDPQQWFRVGERTYEYVSEWCLKYLGLSLDDLDESALIINQKVKELYDIAVEACRREKYKESLELLAFATETLFESNQALRNLSVGNARSEDAIKLAAFGVHANDYLALQEFLPSLVYELAQEHKVVKWDQERYGHPGNWTKVSAEFSLKTFVHVALRIQDANWVPGAHEFDFLYEHQITALVDAVEIVQEKSAFSKERRVVATLQKGEFLRCHVSRKDYKSLNSFIEQFSSAVGVTPKYNILSIISMNPVFWGEVQAEKVRVTCVPKDKEFVRKYFPDLPEVEYEP
jgi:cellobiose-specific phosphotransferase system component IIA